LRDNSIVTVGFDKTAQIVKHPMEQLLFWDSSWLIISFIKNRGLQGPLIDVDILFLWKMLKIKVRKNNPHTLEDRPTGNKKKLLIQTLKHYIRCQLIPWKELLLVFKKKADIFNICYILLLRTTVILLHTLVAEDD
jgi:hypothetical protein